MAQEKKVTEGMVTEATEGKETEVKLVLTRKHFTSKKTKKQMWGYAVEGNVSKRAVKVDFAAKDAGGYEVLDLLFDVAAEIGHEVVLEMREEEMTDNNGVTSSYTVYEAHTTDGAGNDLVCPIKPSQASDKALLGMLLSQLSKGGAVV